jgi:hypothetical protein
MFFISSFFIAVQPISQKAYDSGETERTQGHFRSPMSYFLTKSVILSI